MGGIEISIPVTVFNEVCDVQLMLDKADSQRLKHAMKNSKSKLNSSCWEFTLNINQYRILYILTSYSKLT